MQSRKTHFSIVFCVVPYKKNAGNVFSFKENNRKMCVSALREGSVMSVILFMVALLPLHHILRGLVEFLVYADDLSIHIRLRDMRAIEETFQLVLDSLVDWEKRTGFKISSEKIKVIHFCRLRSRRTPRTDPSLLCRGSQLDIVLKHKVLGVFYDKQLRWKGELAQRKANASEGMNVLRSLAGRHGVEQDVLLRVHSVKTLSVLKLEQKKRIDA